MNDNSIEWRRLRDQYPPLEQPSTEEESSFERWVKDMGFDGIIQLNGTIKNEQSKKSNKRS